MPHGIDLEKHWILQVSKEHDENAFRQLFDLYYAPLVHYSSYIIRSHSLAEEVVSEVFINLWNNRAKLLEVHDFKKYIYTSTKYKTIDYIRKAKNLTFIHLDKQDFEECIIYNNPEDIFIEEEVRERIEAAILRLPEKCRLVYRMIKEEQMKYNEVAELLDISPKTVENQMVIAMKRIREELLTYLNSNNENKRSIFLGMFF